MILGLRTEYYLERGLVVTIQELGDEKGPVGWNCGMGTRTKLEIKRIFVHAKAIVDKSSPTTSQVN